MEEQAKDPAQIEAENEELRKKLEEALIKTDTHLAGWQRAQADYANLKKETENRAKDLIEFANAAFMSEVLPVYSYFKMAMSHVPEEQRKLEWVVGISHIQRQFQDFLKKYKIEEIKTVGEKFDPNFHEAIVHEEKEGFAEDVIFEEVAPGYMVDDKVLMPAKVKVAK